MARDNMQVAAMATRQRPLFMSTRYLITPSPSCRNADVQLRFAMTVRTIAATGVRTSRRAVHRTVRIGLRRARRNPANALMPDVESCRGMSLLGCASAGPTPPLAARRRIDEPPTVPSGKLSSPKKVMLPRAGQQSRTTFHLFTGRPSRCPTVRTDRTRCARITLRTYYFASQI